MIENGSLQKQHSTLSSPQSSGQHPEDSHTNSNVVKPQSLSISVASSRQPDILLRTKSPKEDIIRGIPVAVTGVSSSCPRQGVPIVSEGSLRRKAISRASHEHPVLVPLTENPSNVPQLMTGSSPKNAKILEALRANGAKIPLVLQLPGHTRCSPKPQETTPSRQSGQTQASSGLTSPQAVSSDVQQQWVKWNCTLSSKPTPQRNIQELFTVVGRVPPKLYKKLPDTMTVAEFENPKELDCWPSEDSIDLQLDDGTSDRGRHALKKLSEMKLAAVVHLSEFDFIFVPHPHHGDIALLGLINPPKTSSTAVPAPNP